MKLKIGNFYVKDIIFGETTKFEQGILQINKEEALRVVYEDENITDADLIIAKPGDKVRIVPKEGLSLDIELKRTGFSRVTRAMLKRHYICT